MMKACSYDFCVIVVCVSDDDAGTVDSSGFIIIIVIIAIIIVIIGIFCLWGLAVSTTCCQLSLFRFVSWPCVVRN